MSSFDDIFNNISVLPGLYPPGSVGEKLAQLKYEQTVIERKKYLMPTTDLKGFQFRWESDFKPRKRTHRERSLVQRVVYNDPATIIFWKDGTKTVVKKQDGDVYDAEKGFMAAYLKKMLGNDNQYNYEINWFVPKQKPVEVTINVNVKTPQEQESIIAKAINEAASVDEALKAFAALI